MKRKLKWIIIILVLVVFAAAIGLRLTNSSEPDSFVVEKNDYTYSVAAVGTLGPNEGITIKSEISGVVMRIDSEVGGFVEKNDSLIIFDSEDAMISADIAQNDYNQALNAYNDLIDQQFADAKNKESVYLLEKQNDETSYNNGKTLYEQGAISKSDLEDLQLAYETSLKDYEGARTDRIALDVGGSKRNEYTINLSKAKNRLESAQFDLDMYSITAPYDGYVYDLNVNEGDYVSVGTTLIDIGKDGEYKIVSEIDEKYFNDIKLGQVVLIYIEDQLLDINGKISKKYPKIDDETGAFEIEVLLDEPFDYLVSNLTVNIQINIEVFDEAIGIPNEYVLEENGKYFVYLKNGTEWVETEVFGVTKINNIVIIDNGIEENAILRVVE